MKERMVVSEMGEQWPSEDGSSEDLTNAHEQKKQEYFYKSRERRRVCGGPCKGLSNAVY